MKTFQETQKISVAWVKVLLILTLSACLFILGLLFFTTTFSAWKNDDRLGIQITAFTFILITILFLSSKLETKLDAKGIYVRFLPILVKWRFYAWDEIEKAHIREYSPLMEYGGWGYRIGIMGQGNAYILSGNKGLQLEFKKGKKLLIGTRKEQELSAFLENINTSKSTKQ
jgi:hypothetical protein